MSKLKFISLSMIGFIFFLMPIKVNGNSKIALSHIVSFITDNVYDVFILLTLMIAVIVILGTILFMFYSSGQDYLNEVFKTSTLNRIFRISGSFLYLTVVLGWFEGKLLFDLVLDPNTGGVMAGQGGLLTTLYITFFAGLMALPLLTHFGAVEFIGVMIGRVMEKFFRVPGYSAVDAIASFVGDGTIGIVVTDTQYQRGYYNRRQAYVIATSFSVVGIAFAAAVAEQLGFGSIFPIFYGSIIVVTIILAWITARLPLKKFDESYYEGVEPVTAQMPKGKSLFNYAMDQAIRQADKTTVSQGIKDAFKGIVNIYVGFLPIIMVVGTFSLIIAEHTSFFNMISSPLVHLYEGLGYDSATAEVMAPASVVGFADMYLPALFLSQSFSESARFFIGVMSFTQLVFMSETGMILVKSKIGLNMVDIVKIFVFRTMVSIPILVLITQVLIYVGVLVA